jgi:UDPglucose 6-dehydrogenase
VASVGIFGAGWVGLVTGACFAELGHDVVVRDVVAEKIAALQAGEVPFHETDVPELLSRNRERLKFTLDAADLASCPFLFVCVDTPPTKSGDADLSRVWSVIDDLPELDQRAILVMKSTVPVGTGEKIRHGLEERGLGEIGYVSNPEFLAEGTAVRDFMKPDRIAIGAFEEEDGDAVGSLYASLDAPMVRCDVNSAEMIKLAANAALATRISFINEIANVCESSGADVVKVAEGVGYDKRIGPHFLKAGLGYGGSCLDGRETVLVRMAGRTWLTKLDRLYAELDGKPALPLEVLSWEEGREPRFMPVSAVTRRAFDGEIIHLETKMGRRVRCTPDHPFVTASGIKLAAELAADDWLPVAQGFGEEASTQQPFSTLAGMSVVGLRRENVIVRAPLALAGVTKEGMRERLPEASAGRRIDIRRTNALRLPEARKLRLSLGSASVGTAKNGTYVPVTVDADERLWRVIGLYLAEGHCSVDGSRHRLCWSFHPEREEHLVSEVADFWRAHGVKVSVRRTPTSMSVSVSSRLLAGWWLGTLGLGANSYDHGIPDQIWTAPESHRRALLSGLWQGDGSWSFVNGGLSVVLEYGTVSRRLADGMLRLLSMLGVAARLKVGRTAKSTVDTYWLVISGGQQVEKLLDFVRPDQRPSIEGALGMTKRIAPTGYKREHGVAWMRVKSLSRHPYRGWVYSLEVPGSHTFVTTGGLVTHNCFPKDSLALKQLALNSGYHFQLLAAVIEVNELQKRRVIGKLESHLGSLRGKTVALLGLAFKPNTDDMREAPSIVLAGRLLAEGAKVRGWDPVADGSALPRGVEIVGSVPEAVQGADAAVIVTEWPELRDLASAETRDAMANPLIVDGRNLLDPAAARAAGFVYEGIGRPSPADVLV